MRDFLDYLYPILVSTVSALLLAFIFATASKIDYLEHELCQYEQEYCTKEQLLIKYNQ